MSLNDIRIIISGGGTGGHVFPAIAIANALTAEASNLNILFVGAKGRMEMEKVPAAGYSIEGLWISGLQRSLSLKNLLFPFKLISSMIKSRSIINRFRPQMVVGVGGYASGPLLRVAYSRHIPMLIQEQNSYPGITNKILAKKADKICVAYEGMEKYFPKEKIILTGNPVRQDILSIDNKREKALKHFGLYPHKRTLLIMGGSLGARTINQSIAGSLQRIRESGVQLIWQTGKAGYELAKSAIVGTDGGVIKMHAFITEMDLAYAASDLVISRAGAIAISELCIVGKPAVLVPSPNVAEDHQTKNALSLVQKDAALMVKDDEAEANLVNIALDLLKDDDKRRMLSLNISKLARPDAARTIASVILDMINKS